MCLSRSDAAPAMRDAGRDAYVAAGAGSTRRRARAHRAHVRRPALSGARPGEEPRATSALKVNVLVSAPSQKAAKPSTSTRSICTRRGTRGVHQAGGGRAGRDRRRDQGRPGQAAARSSRAEQEQRCAPRATPKTRRRMRSASRAAHAALALLQRPDLLERILADFDRCGVVGEETQQARRLPRRRVAQARCAAGGADPVDSAPPANPR